MSSEHDGDALLSSKAKAFLLLRGALTKKATAPVLLRLEGLTTITDYFLIVSGNSPKQVKAIADAVDEIADLHKIKRLSAEGVALGNWGLLDYGDVVVHVFRPTVREFYDLEGLWAEAPREWFPEDIRREIEASAESGDEEEDEWQDLA